MTTRIVLALMLALAACKKTPPAPGAGNGNRPAQASKAPGLVEILVDGARTRTFQASDLTGDGKPVRSLFEGPFRSVLVHGDTEKWLRANDLDEVRLCLNRRGEVIKVALKEGGIRAVTRIEFRTPASARVPGEP